MCKYKIFVPKFKPNNAQKVLNMLINIIYTLLDSSYITTFAAPN